MLASTPPPTNDQRTASRQSGFHMARWRWWLFAALANRSCSTAEVLRLPPDRVTEVTRIVKV